MRKILFFGTPHIAVPSLEALHHDPQVEIVGVGVFPDRPVGRKQVMTPCPVKAKAEALNLPVIEIPDKATLVQTFEKTEFDLALVIAFGMIFPSEILSDRRCVNVHFSDLPAYRGASPVQQAILDGKTQTAITWQVMVPQLDAGDILLQVHAFIRDMSTGQVWEDLAKKTAKFMPQFIQDYFAGTLVAQPQKESDATFCGKFTKADGLVDPQTESAQTIYRKYRAFDPWPGIFMKTQKGDTKLKVLSKTSKPESLEIPCLEGSLWIEQAQIPGKPVMPVEEIIKGHPDLFKI